VSVLSTVPTNLNGVFEGWIQSLHEPQFEFSVRAEFIAIDIKSRLSWFFLLLLTGSVGKSVLEYVDKVSPTIGVSVFERLAIREITEGENSGSLFPTRSCSSPLVHEVLKFLLSGRALNRDLSIPKVDPLQPGLMNRALLVSGLDHVTATVLRRQDLKGAMPPQGALAYKTTRDGWYKHEHFVSNLELLLDTVPGSAKLSMANILNSLVGKRVCLVQAPLLFTNPSTLGVKDFVVNRVNHIKRKGRMKSMHEIERAVASRSVFHRVIA
jgi:hypothetical protein